jgi:hypothetical protein
VGVNQLPPDGAVNMCHQLPTIGLIMGLLLREE